tara:strand:- start:685 stop:912 length:228 start_codon:yes stop_codon:yes gene_type:complete
MENFTKDDVEKILDKLHDESMLKSKLRILFEEVLDDDYIPPVRVKKDSYSDSEGSAEEEDFTYTTEDEEGFLSLA